MGDRLGECAMLLCVGLYVVTIMTIRTVCASLTNVAWQTWSAAGLSNVCKGVWEVGCVRWHSEHLSLASLLHAFPLEEAVGGKPSTGLERDIVA